MIIQRHCQAELALDIRQMFGYMSCPQSKASPELRDLVEEVAALARKAVVPKACYCRLPVTITEDSICFGGLLQTKSQSLSRHLARCSQAYLFCATIGPGIDRQITANRLSPARAVAWDAAGTTLVEQWCDDLCAYFGGEQRSRFSPGYGDLPLTLQQPLLELLDAQRKVGVCMTDSLLMTPTKSVTAIVGLVDTGDMP